VFQDGHGGEVWRQLEAGLDMSLSILHSILHIIQDVRHVSNIVVMSAVGSFA
jgi:hypothetical protein